MRNGKQSAEPLKGEATDSGYGRARLCVGISAVGTWVLIAVSGLAFGWPPQIAGAWGGDAPRGLGSEAATLLMFVVGYAVVQLPFDLLGGYVLPRRYGRVVPAWGVYLAGLLRGVTVHGAVLFAVAGVLTVAGHHGGAPAMVGAAVTASLLVLAQRLRLAGALVAMKPVAAPTGIAIEIVSSTRFVKVVDEGFTGGVVGIWRPRFSVVPSAWGPALGEAGLRLAAARRTAAIESGAWRRGRGLALGFTWVGFACCALCVGRSGPAAVGTAAGTIAFSLWFTLWSFVGLLILPTFSRRGVAEVDAQLLAQGTTPDELSAVTRTLDRRQDGEPSRPSWVEAVFHPVPSVNNRRAAPAGRPPRGAWDAARTAVFVSAAGLGLLGRAVHCNCGRPGLWAFLPTE